MRLDATDLRYLPPEAFALLRAVERGSLTHEVVPTTYLAANASSHGGGGAGVAPTGGGAGGSGVTVSAASSSSSLAASGSGLAKLLSLLARKRLVARVRGASYDGWRLTYGGYDWLAVRALASMRALQGVGQRVGVGKESDIYLSISIDEPLELPLASTIHSSPFPTSGASSSSMASSSSSKPSPNAAQRASTPAHPHLPSPTTLPAQTPLVLKVHRLGRISFRRVKEKRSYLGKRRNDLGNWMFLSRLSARREWQFLLLLAAHDFPVPLPVAQSRHALVMTYVPDSTPLYQLRSLGGTEARVGRLYAALVSLVVRLARCGLVHGDFNEFNVLIRRGRRRRRAGRQRREDDGGATEGLQGSVTATKTSVERNGGAGQTGEPPETTTTTTTTRMLGELRLGEGERVEHGRGFVRVFAAPSRDDGDEEEEEGDGDGDVDEQEAEDEAEEEEDDDDVDVGRDDELVDLSDDGDDDDDDDGEEDSEGDVGGDGDSGSGGGGGRGRRVLEPVLIDFPQMVSIEHENAQEYFDRDVECVRTFFLRRFRYVAQHRPDFHDVIGEELEARRRERRLRRGGGGGGDGGGGGARGEAGVESSSETRTTRWPRLDVIGNASGVGGAKADDELSKYIESTRTGSARHGEDDTEGGEDEEEGEEEEEEDDDDEEEKDHDEDEGDQGDGASDDADAAAQERPGKPRPGRGVAATGAAAAAATAPLVSRGAALKALADGDAGPMRAIEAAERERRRRKREAQRRGPRQAQGQARARRGGAAGDAPAPASGSGVTSRKQAKQAARRVAGSKAKVGARAAVHDSLEF